MLEPLSRVARIIVSYADHSVVAFKFVVLVSILNFRPEVTVSEGICAYRGVLGIRKLPFNRYIARLIVLIHRDLTLRVVLSF